MSRGGGGAARLAAGAVVSEEDQLAAAEVPRVLRRTFAMLRPYRRDVVLGSVVIVLSVATLVAGPALVRYGVDEGLPLRGRAGRPEVLNVAAVAYLLVAVVGLVLARAQILLITRVGERFLRDLRVRVFDHIQAQSMAFFDREQTGRLVARMTADIDSLQELVQQGLVQFLANGLLFVLSAGVLVAMSPVLALLCLVAVPPVVVATIRFRRRSNRAYLLVRDRVGQTLATFQEGLSGVRIVQAFGREDSQEERFGRRNQEQLDANIDAVRISARYFPVIEFAGVATTAAVLGVGGVLVHRGRVTEGTVVAFVLLLTNLFEPVLQLSQLFNMVQSAGASLAKLFGLLDTHVAVDERPGAVDLPRVGGVEVGGVSFGYLADRPVLADVSLRIDAGERLALVGPTGAGKSTLAKLVARLYDPTSGTVRFGGVDLRDATLRSLRERIVVVPQEGFLFQGTIADNIRIGRPSAADDEVLAALEVIGVRRHFEALPDGLATEVRERGSRLSAGERQLVSLARAALADPAVLVLDEATSSLDPGTEVEVESAMAALMEGRTVIVIAHRLSTAQRADRVAVVDAGGVIELGTHDELVAAGGRYASLFAAWEGATAR